MSDKTTGAPDSVTSPDTAREARRWVAPLVLALLVALSVVAVTVSLVGGDDADDREPAARDAGDGGDAEEDRVAQERAARDQALAEEAVTICEELDGEGGVAERDRYDALRDARPTPHQLQRAVRDECGDTLTALVSSARAEASAEPAEVSQETADMVARAGFQLYFDDARDGIAGVLETSSEIESVDVMTYDDESETVRVVVSSVYSTEDRLRSVAWDVARAMTVAAFDHREGLWGSLDFDVAWLPDFHLDVNELTYRCAGETMSRIAARDVSRSEWEAACS